MRCRFSVAHQPSGRTVPVTTPRRPPVSKGGFLIGGVEILRKEAYTRRVSCLKESLSFKVMNIEILGYSVPILVLIIIVVRTINRVRDNVEQEKLSKLSVHELAIRLENSKRILEQERIRPRTTFEKAATIVFWGILGTLALGGLADLVYLLFFSK